MGLDDNLSAEYGDPAQVRAEADELKTVAGNIHSAASMLQAIATRGVWDSSSGVLFGLRVGETPEDLVDIANRLLDAEGIMRPYADRLEDDKKYLEDKRSEYERWVTVSDSRQAVVDGMTPDDPRYTEADTSYRHAANQREWAKRRYVQRKDDALLDEQDVGRRLADVGPEGLSDPRGYNGFETASRVGTSSFVNNAAVDWIPFLRPVRTLSAGDPIGQLGRRVFYDEGSYRGVAKSAGNTVVSFIAGRRGGAGTAARNEARATRRAGELAAVKKRYSSTSTKSVATQRWTDRARLSGQRHLATRAVKSKHQVIDKLANTSGTRMIDDMAADWASLAGSGHVRKGKHIITYSVASGQKVSSHVSTARTTADRIDGRDAEERQAQRERRTQEERRQSADRVTRDPVSPTP